MNASHLIDRHFFPAKNLMLNLFLSPLRLLGSLCPCRGQSVFSALQLCHYLPGFEIVSEAIEDKRIKNLNCVSELSNESADAVGIFRMLLPSLLHHVCNLSGLSLPQTSPSSFPVQYLRSLKMHRIDLSQIGIFKGLRLLRQACLCIK